MASVQPRVRRRRLPWHLVVFLAPAVLIYMAFMVYPLFESLRLSLFWRRMARFVGTANYHQLLTDNNFAPRFWGALGTTRLLRDPHAAAEPDRAAAGGDPAAPASCAAGPSTGR